MANKSLFKSIAGKLLPKTNTVNSHGAPTYKLDDKHALAQLAATGCLNATFYASADTQLDTILTLAGNVEPEFIAKTALYARTRGYMKDMPALLCAILSVTSPGLMAEIFDRVIDSPKMLRKFVQIMRSGTVGRKSLGSLPKKLVQRWIDSRTSEQLFLGSVGNDPSLADIIKMVHPKPATKAREALFAYLIGRECDASLLPPIVRQFEAFKKGETRDVPDVPFQMLTALPLGTQEWKAIATNASWQTTRMNLNTFARHGVFSEGQAMSRMIAARMADKELVRKARAFPYQLMNAYLNVTREVPSEIKEALQDAMEIATHNVPKIEAKVHIFVDISGSMHSPITGHRQGATTTVRCVDVAALIAATIVRRNPSAEILPFESKAIEDFSFNPRDSVMTNAKKLSSLPCGGTNCSAPLAVLNKRKAFGDLIVYVSDNESWVDAPYYGRFGGSRTETLNQWAQFKARNPAARMVCIDLVPNTHTQAAERVGEILNIGGFSDSVFDVIARFADGTLDPHHWVGVIERERI
ncbi:MAG TPA: RNA-binding protein [Phycisphaerae bacterium]|nr:RNA-binding protein [Phycisphaerae bacterium]